MVFDGVVEAVPGADGGDSFERVMAGGFLLAPGRYEAIVTLLAPRPAFESCRTTLTLTSDKGHALYGQ